MSQIKFSLFAPYNEKAALIGNFSDWEDIPMKKDDEGFFRTQVDLEDGEYEYKFRVQSKSWFLDPDTWVDIIDPCATDIHDAHQTGIVRVKEGDRIVDTYTWQHDDTPLPSDRQLIIYELHVGDFSGGEDDPYPRGQYQHVIEKLDYLCDLGINAIEFMPLKEYPGDRSWGYNPRHFFATESSYGTTDDLKHLIDECHARGIRIIQDGVYNHSESECPLTQIDHDYWYYHEPQDPDNNWGPEFDYEHYDENLDTYPARRFVGDVIRFWIQEYHLDGIRFDAIKQIENCDFMYWIAEETKKTAGMKPFYNIAEHIPDTPDITNQDGPMDGCWHHTFCGSIIEHLAGDRFDLEELKSMLEPRRRGYLDVTNVVNYLSNHDRNRMMVEFTNREIFDEDAFRRMKLGFVLLLTAVGVPMIRMGDEFGEYKAQTIEQCKLDWTLLNNEENRDLLAYCKGLIHLRKDNYALHTTHIDFFYESLEDRVLAYVRWNDEGSRVVVVANFSDRFLSDYTIPNFPEDGNWHEWTYDYDVEVRDGSLTLDLGEHEAKVFV